STGWGGAFGIASSALLRTHIGAFGTLILLVGGWILTGVFINRNFINKVNEAGNVVVDKSGKVVEILKHKVVLHGRAAGEDGAAEDVPEPAPKPGPKAAAPQPAPPKAAEPAVQKPAPIRVERPSEPVAARKSVPEEDENPFLELTPDGKPVAGETAAEQTPPPAEDGEFIEVDLSRPEGRVVIGRSGLVELERPAVRDAVPAEPAPEEVPEREAAQSDPDAPFTEITVLDDAPAAEPEGVVVTVEANEAKLLDEKAIPTESYDPLKDLVNYRKPPVTLLEDYISDSEVSDEEIFENKTKIEDTLKNFGIPIQRIKATVGPTVTLYEIVQAQGIKISKVQGLENDIAQSLKALGIRIIAPIPGKGTIGIEVPNRDKQVVSMYSAVRSLRFQESKAELPVVIGRTIQNENYVFDLAKMPHLLVAGATGQGKSVGLNAIITSLLYRKHPAQLKFVMIDPKMVEFSLYAKIERHFLAKMESEDDAIITDPKKAVYTLNSLCTEMDNRLELCKKAGARNIAEYNEKFTSRRLNPMNGHRYLPYIVVVVDEFADLIMTAREVEGPVMRLAQKARAIGIHLIIATQRPDVKVITGGIKANFPARIAFRVMQMIDSRTIIDQPGANQLIGRGDMLFSKDGDLTRIQCALVETREVERICEYISKQQGYTEAYTLPDYTPDGGDAQMGSEESSAPVKYDSLFAEIARDAVSGGQISTSMIQRNYEVGFNRAGRIMMQLERAGIVGRQQGAKPRDILYHDLPSLEAKLQELGLF
uniref:DNA translocase FtsK n=2 Tax=Alistipes shahii TaxID=328814 RepID=UPI003AF7EEDE